MSRIAVHPAEHGHYAECDCGFRTRVYPVPDTAYTAAKSHQCETKKKKKKKDRA